MQSISTTTIVYRIQEEPEIANERHVVIADIPPEARIPQVHQTIISPSASQVINVLSDASYPLGFAVKRKFLGRHASLHRIKSDIMSILDDTEQKRLEAIFWNSKKGWPRTSYLEDELKAFLRSKALEKKNRHKASVITSTLEPAPPTAGRRKKSSVAAKEPPQPSKRRDSRLRNLKRTPSKEGQLKEIMLRRKYTDAELEDLYEKQGLSTHLVQRSPTSSEDSGSSTPSEYAKKGPLSIIDSTSTLGQDRGYRYDPTKGKVSISTIDRKTDLRKTSLKDKKGKLRRGSGIALHDSVRDLTKKDSKANFKRGLIYDDEDRATKVIRDQLSKIKPIAPEDWDEDLSYLKALAEEKKRRRKLSLTKLGDEQVAMELRTGKASVDDKKAKDKKAKASRDPFAAIKYLGDEDIDKEYNYWKSIYEMKKMQERTRETPVSPKEGRRRHTKEASELDEETRLMKAIEEEKRRREKKEKYAPELDPDRSRRESEKRKRKKPHSSILPDDLDEYVKKRAQAQQVTRKRSIGSTLGMKHVKTGRRRSSVYSKGSSSSLQSSHLSSRRRSMFSDELSEELWPKNDWKQKWHWAADKISKMLHGPVEVLDPALMPRQPDRRVSDKVPVSVQKTLGSLYKKTKRKKAKETWFSMRWDDIAKDASPAPLPIETLPVDESADQVSRLSYAAPKTKLFTSYKAASTEKETEVNISSIETKVAAKTGSKEKVKPDRSPTSATDIKMMFKSDRPSPEAIHIRRDKSLKDVVSIESVQTESLKSDVKKTSKKEASKAEKEKQKRQRPRKSSVYPPEISEAVAKGQRKSSAREDASVDFRTKNKNVDDWVLRDRELSDEDLSVGDEFDSIFGKMSPEKKELRRQLSDEDESAVDLTAFDLLVKDNLSEESEERKLPERVVAEEIKKRRKSVTRKPSIAKIKRDKKRLRSMSKDEQPDEEEVIAEVVAKTSPDAQKQKSRKRKQHLGEEPTYYDQPRLSRSDADVIYEGETSYHEKDLGRKAKSEVDTHMKKLHIDLERNLSRRLTSSPVERSESIYPKDYTEDDKKARKSREDRLEEKTTKVIKEVITRLEQHVIKTQGKLRYEKSEADMARKAEDDDRPDESPMDEKVYAPPERKLSQKASIKALKRYSKSKESGLTQEKERAKPSRLKSAAGKRGVDESDIVKDREKDRSEDESQPAKEYSEDEYEALEQEDIERKEDKLKRMALEEEEGIEVESGKSSASMLEGEDIKLVPSESLESGSVKRRLASSEGSLTSGKGLLRKISSEVYSEEYDKEKKRISRTSFESDGVLVRHKQSTDDIDRRDDRQKLTKTIIDKDGTVLKRTESLESVDLEDYRREKRLSRTIDREGFHILHKESKDSVDKQQRKVERMSSKTSEDRDSEYASLKHGVSKTSADRDSVKLKSKESKESTDKEEVKSKRKAPKKATEKDVALKRRESKEGGKFRRKISQKSIDSDDGGPIESDVVSARRKLSRASSVDIGEKRMKRQMSKTAVDKGTKPKQKESGEKIGRQVFKRKLDEEDVELKHRKLKEGEETWEAGYRQRLTQDGTEIKEKIPKGVDSGEISPSVASEESVDRDVSGKEKIHRELSEEGIDDARIRSALSKSVESSVVSEDEERVKATLSEVRSDEEDVWPTIKVRESIIDRTRPRSGSRQTDEERARRKGSRPSTAATVDGEEIVEQRKHSKRRKESVDLGSSPTLDSEDAMLESMKVIKGPGQGRRDSYAITMDRRKQSIFRSVSSLTPETQSELRNLGESLGLGPQKDDRFKIADRKSSKDPKYRGMDFEDDAHFMSEPLRSRDKDKPEKILDLSKLTERDEGPSARDSTHRRKDRMHDEEYLDESLERIDSDRQEKVRYYVPSPLDDQEDDGARHKPKERGIRGKPQRGDLSQLPDREHPPKTIHGHKKESRKAPKIRQDYLEGEVLSSERSDAESLLSVESSADSESVASVQHKKPSKKGQLKLPGDQSKDSSRGSSFQHFPSITTDKEAEPPIAYEKHPSYFARLIGSPELADARSSSTTESILGHPSKVIREESAEWSSTETTVTSTELHKGVILPKISKRRRSSSDLMAEINKFKTRIVLPSIEKLVPLQPRLEKDFEGWDVGARVEKHSLPELPSIVDRASQLIKTYTPKKLSDYQRSHLLEVEVPGYSSMEEGIRYVHYFGIEELFEYMISNLVLAKPENAMEFLIDLTKHIKKEMKIRFNVGMMMMAGNNPLEDSSSRKSNSVDSESDFGGSSEF